METSAQIFRGDSRNMAELSDESIDLVVTSPPYWQIKDYGTEDQLGYGQSLHDYLYDLCRVWQECFRILQPGRKLCINIGDQFARTAIYGRYKIIPIHSEITMQCESTGFDFLGSIIWQKKTTINSTGGTAIMGSFPHPPNGIVELDYEHILLFKKPGTSNKPTEEQKRRSELSKEDWKLYFAGHWNFGGARQGDHEAMFPEELPRRLIRMFSFTGETILDPFLGSGTTAKVAMDLERNTIGYEINPNYIPLIRERLGEGSLISYPAIFQDQKPTKPVDIQSRYHPQVQNAMPIRDTQEFEEAREKLYRVIEVINETTLRLDSGEEISLLGIRVPELLHAKSRTYLQEFVLNKQVIIRIDDKHQHKDPGIPQSAYLYLKNKIFINKKMIEMGIAIAERNIEYKFKSKFISSES
jgi:DNA modification methylase/endonuclease YncB( thermonuclease family)